MLGWGHSFCYCTHTQKTGLSTMNGQNLESRLVIGLTGPLGSGVSTTSRVLASKGFHRVSVSDAIKVEYKKKNSVDPDAPLPRTSEIRNQLQDLGNQGRQTHPGYWLEKALERVPTGVPLVIDGIRNLGEVIWLRERFPKFFLVAVIADSESRWERVAGDYGRNLGEFERDDARDSDEELNYGQQVQKCVVDSDYVLLNKDASHRNATVWERQIWDGLKETIPLMKGEAGRQPWDIEVYMAMANAQSHMSLCLKRHVGAVIVGADGLPLTTGYNENPVTMKPCKTAFDYCYKDMDMSTKLENLRDLFCPFCGRKNEALASDWRCIGCGKDLKSKLFPSRNMELCTAIHAEERAIRSLRGQSAEGATMYVTTFPCFQCARY